jgi:hypothetical protein
MIQIKESFHTIDRGEKFIIAQLKALGSGAEITTGIQPEDFNKVQMIGKKTSTGNKTPLGIYAAMNEFGTKKSPARPFMLKTMDMTMDAFVTQTMAGMRSIYNGNLTIEKLMSRQAKRTQKAMKTTIKTWTNPSNTAGTMRAKGKRKGSTPLQETRTMLKNIKSKVKFLGGPLHPGLAKLKLVADNRLVKRRGIFG